MKVNWDDDIPNIWENKKWQPNHQPVLFFLCLGKSIRPVHVKFQDSPWEPMATSATGSRVEAKSPDRLAAGPAAADVAERTQSPSRDDIS